MWSRKSLADSSGKIIDHAGISGKNSKDTGSERSDKEIETNFLARETAKRSLENGV
jgi:hypothetical protein